MGVDVGVWVLRHMSVWVEQHSVVKVVTVELRRMVCAEVLIVREVWMDVFLVV
jgi:hypothetical protein